MAFVLAFIAAIGFAGATALVDTTIGRSRLFHHVSVVVAAGILLGVAVADLVPEAFEAAGTRTSALAIAGGFLALYLIEALTQGHTHHHEPHAHGHAHAHAHSHAHTHEAPSAGESSCVPTHPIVPFLLGLGLHNVVDGIVIGASHEVGDRAATGVAVGILIHQLPVGLSFAAVLVGAGYAARALWGRAFAVAAMIPVGTALVALIPSLTGDTLGALTGAAAGAIIYIATGHLLPEAQSEERRPGIAVAFTAALLGSVLFMTAIGG